MRKLLLGQRRKFHKATPTIAESAQLLLRADVIGDVQGFEQQLGDEHRQCKEDEEQKDACESEEGKKNEPKRHRSCRCYPPFAEAPYP
eukprot:1988865-Prymnesium_polylepis.1